MHNLGIPLDSQPLLKEQMVAVARYNFIQVYLVPQLHPLSRQEAFLSVTHAYVSRIALEECLKAVICSWYGQFQTFDFIFIEHHCPMNYNGACRLLDVIPVLVITYKWHRSGYLQCCLSPIVSAQPTRCNREGIFWAFSIKQCHFLDLELSATVAMLWNNTPCISRRPNSVSHLQVVEDLAVALNICFILAMGCMLPWASQVVCCHLCFNS